MERCLTPGGRCSLVWHARQAVPRGLQHGVSGKAQRLRVCFVCEGRPGEASCCLPVGRQHCLWRAEGLPSSSPACGLCTSQCTQEPRDLRLGARRFVSATSLPRKMHTSTYRTFHAVQRVLRGSGLVPFTPEESRSGSGSVPCPIPEVVPEAAPQPAVRAHTRAPRGTVTSVLGEITSLYQLSRWEGLSFIKQRLFFYVPTILNNRLNAWFKAVSRNVNMFLTQTKRNFFS